jgi:hypothetical protein
MKLIIFIGLLVASSISNAEGVKEVHVERRDIGEVLGKIVSLRQHSSTIKI